MTRIHLPSPLFSYTGGVADFDAQGATIAELLDDLDRRFPGLRFRVVDEQDRIRSTILFFVNETVAREITHPVKQDDDVRIIAALSGG